MYNYNKQLIEEGVFDVIVVGAGCAGSTAAIAAARSGATTLLLERLPFLGGTSTAVLDTFYGFYTPGSQSKKVVGGIADEVVAGLKRYNACLERPNTFGAGTGITYHPEYLKVVWEQLVRSSGCQILLNTWVQDVVKEGDRISRLVVATKQGLIHLKAKYIIDTSGDADVCHYAGLPYELAGKESPAQTLTTTFKMINVDMERRKTVSKPEFNALLAKAAGTGQYHLPRKEGSDHITPVPHTTATIMTRLKSYGVREGKTINATDPAFLSHAEMDGRLQALEYIRFLKEWIPGYEQAELGSFGVHIGIRETRRIHGIYRLSSTEVLEARKFEDQIGLCGAPMEDHHDGADTRWQYLPDGQCVGIPYRTLLPQGAENVWVAGRCFSADHTAHSSVRSIGQCMAMGHAAGVAAGLALKGNQPAQAIDIQLLRNQLRSEGAIIDE